MPARTVKFYNGEKGFGFISKDDGSGEMFVHITKAPRKSKSSLRVNACGSTSRSATLRQAGSDCGGAGRLTMTARHRITYI